MFVFNPVYSIFNVYQSSCIIVSLRVLVLTTLVIAHFHPLGVATRKLRR